jgi:WD40 repeat protein
VFSADGKTVFTAGADHQIVEWDAATGNVRSTSRLKMPERVRPKWEQTGERRGFASPDVVVLSPEGKRVAVACNGNTLNELLVFDRATGTELLGLKTGFPPTHQWYLPPTFTSDASGLFYTRANFSPLREADRGIPLWDIESGLSRCRIQLQHQDSFPFPAAFSPDGTRIVTFTVDRDAMKSSLLVGSWNSATGAKSAEHVVFTGKGLSLDRGHIAVSPDNRTALVAAHGSSEKSQLFTWDITNGKVVKEIQIPDEFALTGPLAISKDGKTAAVAGRRGRLNDKSMVVVCELATGKVLRNCRGSEEWVTTLALSPDGKTLAAGSTDTTVLLWDLAGAK